VLITRPAEAEQPHSTIRYTYTGTESPTLCGELHSDFLVHAPGHHSLQAAAFYGLPHEDQKLLVLLQVGAQNLMILLDAPAAG